MEMPHYVPKYFYLGDGINKVDLMDVYKLADLAVELITSYYAYETDNSVSDDKTKECLDVLKSYINNYISGGNYNNENMNNLVNCYKLLDSYPLGRELLSRTIHFKLWNKFLLNKGISMDMINAFSKVHDDLKAIEQIGTTINKEANMRNYNDSNTKRK